MFSSTYLTSIHPHGIPPISPAQQQFMYSTYNPVNLSLLGVCSCYSALDYSTFPPTSIPPSLAQCLLFCAYTAIFDRHGGVQQIHVDKLYNCNKKSERDYSLSNETHHHEIDWSRLCGRAYKAIVVREVILRCGWYGELWDLIDISDRVCCK